MSKRPNILFLMTDEHRADVTGYEGNHVVRTPTLDRLASTGVVFRNAYCPSPVCIPGRQCMMAGQLPMTCGCRHYGDDLPAHYMTFARWFTRYAYETVCCGKLHHMGPDQMQGWSRRPYGDLHVEKPGADTILPEEKVRYVDPEVVLKWSDQKEVQRACAGYSRWMRFDEMATRAAEDVILEHYADPYWDHGHPMVPLLLKVSLIQPHYPYVTDEKKFVYYLNRVAPYVEHEVFNHPFLSDKHLEPGVDVSPREIRRATAAYYGMIETADDHFETVLTALNGVGQDLDDWIIVYTSDHGEMLGEHGVWEKFKFFEGSVRVPLIIRWPKGFPGGRVIKENVNLCDLFATLCDLAGLPIPEGLDSRSLAPLLRGDAVGWDNETISEQNGANLMIKRDALKYQWYGESRSEVLFDLERDPREQENFIADPQYAEQISAFRARRDTWGHHPGT